MAILEEGNAILMEKIAPANIPMPNIATWAGKRMELHCTALGKALLAHLADCRIEQLIKRSGLLRHNANTIASLPKLKGALRKNPQPGLRRGRRRGRDWRPLYRSASAQ